VDAWRIRAANIPSRGEVRTHSRFAWLPVRLGFGDSERGLTTLGGIAWLEPYEQREVWFDKYYNQDYRWRLIARLLPEPIRDWP
jgi:hypothetical protein